MSATGRMLLTALFASAALLAQQTRAPSSPSAGLEFPVTMNQNVSAGKTPVGTRVQAKLKVATMVNGVVVPRDATLSGEVTESVAKSATDPSRLAIHVDSAHWKNRSVAIDVYLTAWYYPVATPAANDLSHDPTATALPPKVWDRTSAPHSAPTAPASQPFPAGAGDTDKDTALVLPAPPASDISNHRVLMKDVESTRNNKDGAVTLTSKHFTIKLDRSTTYVLAAGNLAAGPG